MRVEGNFSSKKRAAVAKAQVLHPVSRLNHPNSEESSTPSFTKIANSHSLFVIFNRSKKESDPDIIFQISIYNFIYRRLFKMVFIGFQLRKTGKFDKF